MKIKHLYNAAIMIETEKVKLVVDALAEDENLFFDMNSIIESKIFKRAGCFEGLSAMLFTHCHDDHFSEAKVKKMIIENPDINICLPYDDKVDMCHEINRGSKFNSVMMLQQQKGEFYYYDIKISYFCSGHISEERVGGDRHYCYMLEDGQDKIVITGDFNTAKIDEVRKWAGENVTKVYANPLILGKDSIVSALGDWKAAQLFIYHIPDAGKPTAGLYGRLATSKEKQYSKELNIKLLNNKEEPC